MSLPLTGKNIFWGWWSVCGCTYYKPRDNLCHTYNKHYYWKKNFPSLSSSVWQSDFFLVFKIIWPLLHYLFVCFLFWFLVFFGGLKEIMFSSWCAGWKRKIVFRTTQFKTINQIKDQKKMNISYLKINLA